MIDYGDKTLNILDKKRIYLIDKINAYFRQVTCYKTNPTMAKKELTVGFDKKVDKSLEIFK